MTNLSNLSILTFYYSIENKLTSFFINYHDQSIVLNNSFVDNVLVLLICFSLCLTFYKNGTSIHKVIGLLLTSIFVVFLWIIKTQFLFIYIVYILAFISAVLMLFLSVVLMLPISQSYNSKLINKNYLKIKHKYFMLNFDPELFNDNTSQLSNEPTFTYVITVLIFIFFFYFLISWKRSHLPRILMIKINIRSILLLSFQTYLFINMFLFFIGNFLIKQEFHNNFNEVFTNTDESSLAALKFILYDSHAYLMLSCLCVLFVALIGAAILTRFNKK